MVMRLGLDAALSMAGGELITGVGLDTVSNFSLASPKGEAGRGGEYSQTEFRASNP